MTETQVQANGLRRPKGISCGDAAGVWLKAAEREDSGKRYQGLPVTGSSPGEQASSQLGQDPGLDSQGENRHRRARSTTGIPTQGEGQRGRCSDLLTRAQETQLIHPICRQSSPKCPTKGPLRLQQRLRQQSWDWLQSPPTGKPSAGALGTTETALGLQACVGMMADPGGRSQLVPH